MVDDERMPLQPGESAEHEDGSLPHARLLPAHRRHRIDATTLPEIIDEMLLATNSERQGRVIDHDEAGSMETEEARGVFLMTNSRPIADDFELLLERHDRKGMVRLLTAGSVDDGKSTLIGRLLYDTRHDLRRPAGASVKKRRAKRGDDRRDSTSRSSPTACSPSVSRASPSTSRTATSRPPTRKFIIADYAGPRAIHAQHGDRRLELPTSP